MRKFLSYCALAGAILSSAGFAHAQDDGIEGLVTTDSQEQELPAIPRVQGPITLSLIHI